MTKSNKCFQLPTGLYLEQTWCLGAQTKHMQRREKSNQYRSELVP